MSYRQYSVFPRNALRPEDGTHSSSGFRVRVQLVYAPPGISPTDQTLRLTSAYLGKNAAWRYAKRSLSYQARRDVQHATDFSAGSRLPFSRSDTLIPFCSTHPTVKCRKDSVDILGEHEAQSSTSENKLLSRGTVYPRVERTLLAAGVNTIFSS
nr:hypothetical protein CFP56_79423 [Quercus suber]